MVDNSMNFGSANYYDKTNQRGWISFACGGAITFILIYFGIARPASNELSLMRDQIRSLEKSVALVAGERDAVDDTNHLLGQLSQQQSQMITARKALIEMRDLTNRLMAESARIQAASNTIEQLASLKNRLIDSSDNLDVAAEAMTANEDLHQRLTDSAVSNESALHASLDLLALRGELLRDASSNDQARAALKDLIEIREALDREGTAVHVAQDRVDGLIELKNSVIERTNDLAESIETLELTQDLSDRFREAAVSFKEIRDWMVDMVTMESTFLQVRRILEPMTELVNLKRMDSKQLRDFTRAFVQQSQERLASKSNKFAAIRSSSESDATSNEFSGDSTIE